MNIAGITSRHWQGVVTDAASAQLALLDEARKINYWPQDIAKIEEALSNARALRSAARMQLLQPENPGTPPASGESLYPYFTNWVRFLRFSGRLIAINHWI